MIAKIVHTAKLTVKARVDRPSALFCSPLLTVELNCIASLPWPKSSVRPHGRLQKIGLMQIKIDIEKSSF